MTVDNAGNLYVASGHHVVKVPAGGGSQTTVVSSAMIANGVAVDAAGNIYISAVAPDRIIKVPSGRSLPRSTPGVNGSRPPPTPQLTSMPAASLPAVRYVTAGAYTVHTSMFLRTTPLRLGHHGVFLHTGDLLTAVRAPTGQVSWTTHWRFVRADEGATGYAYVVNLAGATPSY
jgi:hypothetical protein